MCSLGMVGAQGVATLGVGSLLGVVAILTNISTTKATQPPARTKWNHPPRYGRSATSHRLTPNSRAQLIGRRYFRQVIITWSMRSRGSVQRAHIMTKTSSHALRTKTTALIRLPTLRIG